MPILKFRNVDLEVESRTKLDGLAAEFEKTAFMYNGRVESRYLLAVESHVLRRTPDALIRDLLNIISRLSPQARQLWQKASRRTFDIGFDVKSLSTSTSFRLEPETLEKMAAAGAGFAITIYPTTLKKVPLPTK